MILYDFKAGLIQKECVQLLQLAFVDELPCRATILRYGHNSLQDSEHAGRPRSAVIPDNASVIRKMLMDDNHCT
ncbi:UNVERIFIED_CONTAM: hypothetical protein NCL1_36335 [Trichonephila clavipes]